MAHTPSPGDDVRFLGGLAYAAPIGFRPLLLDLYLPASGGGSGVPLVVFLHGGGWLRGDRSMVSPSVRGRGGPGRWRGWRRTGSRSPRSTTGSAARRASRPSSRTCRRRSSG